VATYFLDSSAVVKRYVAERGSAWIAGLTDPQSGNRILVARIAGVEVIAAIARVARGIGVAHPNVSQVLADFRLDFGTQFRIVPTTKLVLDQAMALAEKHALRGYDAVQLAATLLTNSRRIRRGLKPLVLVSSDLELNAAAIAEGLTVLDPNSYP
jgi:predicted nucleic acid-binding protein